MSDSNNKVFLAYWDCLGFECVIDISKVRDEYCFAKLADKKYEMHVNLTHLKLRARFNNQRYPEIWTFCVDEELEEEDIVEFSTENPQELVNFIRKNGTCLYRTPQEKRVIT